MSRVIVIGGGVMGSSAAWALASRGADVLLLEQFEPGHVYGSSHGASRIFRLAYPDEFYVGLAASAYDGWRELERSTGRSLLSLTGAVDHGPESTTRLLHDTLVAAGHAAELLSPAAAADLWPGLRFDTSVLFHPTAGRVEADGSVVAFQEAALAAGAEIRHGTTVVEIDLDQQAAVTVTTADGEQHTANAVVVAVGGWADRVLARLTDRLPPLRVTLEQPVTFPADASAEWPSFIHHGGAAITPELGIYGMGGRDGVKLGHHGVGPVIDPSNLDRRADPAALARIVDYARDWLPGVDVSAPEPVRCIYTITPDHDFVVDRVGPVTVLAGFSGHGFKFAPAIGALAADLVLDHASGPPRFALGRHRTAVSA